MRPRLQLISTAPLGTLRVLLLDEGGRVIWSHRVTSEEAGRELIDYLRRSLEKLGLPHSREGQRETLASLVGDDDPPFGRVA
jgi:hypothetical protein